MVLKKKFPGFDHVAIRCSPCRNEPHEIMLPDEMKVKGCSECGSWTDHFCAGCMTHKTPAEDENHAGGANLEFGEVSESESENENEDEMDGVSYGTFVRLHLDSLI